MPINSNFWINYVPTNYIFIEKSPSSLHVQSLLERKTNTLAIAAMTHSHISFLLPIQLLLVLLLVIKVAAKVPAIIVFGDSSVDAGNNNQIPTVARSNFQPYGRDFSGGKPTGRFSNGLIPTDFISKSFGLKPSIPAYLDPSYNISDFATGVTFASAGTGYDTATSDVLVCIFVPSI